MARKNPPLTETHPHLIQEWHDERDASEFSSGSKYYAQWKCEKNHTWSTKIFYRTYDGNNCPYCSNKKILVGYNDLATTHPYLIDEWADERKISNFTKGSKKVVEWRCKKYSDHIYTTSVSNKANNNVQCHYCNSRKVLVGFNDLTTTFPDIAKEWAYEKNKKRPEEFSSGSNAKVYWKCSKNEKHIWCAKIANRTFHNSGCHYCAGKKVLKGDNDLATTHPYLIDEWCDKENINDYTAGSHYYAQWKCRTCHHIWSAKVYNRTKEKFTSCPICSRQSYVSKKEQEVYDYICSVLPEGTFVEQSNRKLISKELDIYIPDKSIAIEFNGLYWHTESQGKDKYYHYNKWKECKDKGIQLLTIWEDDWDHKNSVVKNILKHKLSSVSDTIYARNTMFTEIGVHSGSDFLDAYHLQGSNKAAKHYALTVDSEIVAVMSTRFMKKNKQLEIKRFATKANIPGGFSKLLKNIIDMHVSEYIVDNEYMGAEKVVSYSHNDHSLGDVYEKNGFINVHMGNPGYHYVVNNQREFRLNYSPKKFRERDDLFYEVGLNERELAELNGLERIWDCGSSLWEKIIYTDIP